MCCETMKWLQRFKKLGKNKFWCSRTVDTHNLILLNEYEISQVVIKMLPKNRTFISERVSEPSAI